MMSFVNPDPALSIALVTDPTTMRDIACFLSQAGNSIIYFSEKSIRESLIFSLVFSEAEPGAAIGRCISKQ
jgi:hypothetical protein